MRQLITTKINLFTTPAKAIYDSGHLLGVGPEVYVCTYMYVYDDDDEFAPRDEPGEHQAL